jgi:gamma-glutamylcyclotransferase (GGCT)/AIG2-like uncharacterized protein YtfP
MSQSFFVYGTLMYPEVLRLLLGKTFSSVPAFCEGYKRYRIFDAEKNPRLYPAIFPCEGSRAEGIVLFDVDENSVRIMEKYEDKEYEKTELTVQTKKGHLYVQTFVFQKKYKDMLIGEWDEEHFREHQLDGFLQTIHKHMCDIHEK